MKKIRLRAINLPKGFISRWIEYEVEEIPGDSVKAFDKWLIDLMCVADGSKTEKDFDDKRNYESFVELVKYIREELPKEPELTQKLLHHCLNLYPKEGMVSKDEVLKVFDNVLKHNGLYGSTTPLIVPHLRKAISNM